MLKSEFRAKAMADRVGWRLDRHYSLPPDREYSSHDKVLTSIYLDKNWLQYRARSNPPSLKLRRIHPRSVGVWRVAIWMDWNPNDWVW